MEMTIRNRIEDDIRQDERNKVLDDFAKRIKKEAFSIKDGILRVILEKDIDKILQEMKNT